ncbi:unnamed protein product, partial [Rotaria sordida]
MSLPLHERYRIIFLSKDKYGPKFNVSQVAKLIKCHKTTVRRWLDRWEETKDLNDRPRTGRSRIKTAEDDKLIVDLAEQDIDEGITTKQVQEELEDRGVNISRRTVENRLIEAGFNYSKPLSKPLLSPKHQRNRLIWAKSMKNYDWNKIIVSDETTIRLNAVKKYFWQRSGERKVILTVKYPLKVNIWGCLPVKGFGRVVCFHHNLNSSFLCSKIYKNALLPTARTHFGRGRDWVLVEDNDPKHRSRTSIEWEKKHHVTSLPWPSQSPDANPIENLWSLFKIKIAARKPKTMKDLQKSIYKEWNNLPTELASKLVW